MRQIDRLDRFYEGSRIGDARFPCIWHADGQARGIRLAGHEVFTVRFLQALLGFGESPGGLCTLIGSKCVDVIRSRIVIRLQVSAKAGSVGSARFANNHMLGGCRG